MNVETRLDISSKLREEIQFNAGEFRESLSPAEFADYIEGLLQEAFKLGRDSV